MDEFRVKRECTPLIVSSKRCSQQLIDDGSERTKHFSIARRRSSFYWHISVHAGRGRGLLLLPDSTRQRGAHRQPRNRLLAVLFEKDGGDANRQGDKAERKSRALRRSGKSRRRRFCLSGRCRGRRPWSGGPEGEQR